MSGPVDRRLQFVVGKGGVGKTTVAAALARLLVRRGRRTLAVEMDPGGRLAALLGAPGASYSAVEVAPNLSVMTIDGRTALEEYLGLIIPVKRLLAGVFASKVYQYFVAAAPGLRELMTIGKIWYEVTRTDGGRPVWDAIVVDAPATGHSLQVLRMPQAARDSFGPGLVQREAAKITDLLRDRRTTAIHLVTLAEEMPVTETLEMHAQLVGPLALPLGHVVANRLHRRRFDPEVLEPLRAAGVAADDRALLACVAERAALESGWADINAAQLARLRLGLRDAPVIELPFLFAEEFGEAELATLSHLLEDGTADARRASRGRAR